MMEKTASFDASQETGYDVVVVVPSTVVSNTCQECIILFNAPLPRNIDFFVKFASPHKTSFVKAERLNDTAMKFQTPYNFPTGACKISIHNKSNKNLLCRYKEDFLFESNLEAVHSILQTVSDPISFMADALDVENDDGIAIDFTLEKIFKANRPPNFHLLKDKETDLNIYTSELHHSRNPTLLHFAARYNLVRLCLALSDSPGGKEALNLQNLDGLYPHNLAEQCKNDSLARLLVEAKDNDASTSQRGSKCADEIYEQMSPELFKHYKQVKKTFVFSKDAQSFDSASSDPYGGVGVDEDDDEDGGEYEDMELNNNISAPNSRESSLKAFGFPQLSTRSCSVPDIAKGLQGPAQSNGQVKPMNPLLDELRRRNDIKRTSAPVITPLPRGFNTRAGLPNGTKPVYKKQLSIEEIDHVSSTTPPNDDIYDIPTSRPSQLFPAPPPWVANSNAQTTANHNRPQQFYNHNDKKGADEIYDSPPPRKTPLPSPHVEQKPLPGMEIYDSPPIKPPQQPNMEIYDLPPNKTNAQFNDDIYDMPPPPKSAQPPGMEIYDSPPVKGHAQPNMEIYDMPPPKNTQQQPGMEIYDSPPVKGKLQQRLSGMEIYDSPSSRSSENGLYIPASNFLRDEIDDMYEVPPQRTLPTDMTSLKQNRLSQEQEGYETYDTPTKNSNHFIEDDTYEVPPRLSASTEELSFNPNLHNNRSPPKMPPSRLNAKRFSEPVLPQFSAADKARLIQRQQVAIQRNHGTAGTPQPPPSAPSIPPRNPTNKQQQQQSPNQPPQPLQRSPKFQRRPMNAPPLPPSRVPKR
ncbi:uncharacterized protein [Clytia hemisphaerica]|uniref:DBB domain-containing protein n=1 Tax=Clytia hemisphaerica TaxID=252671 RepID=A0A7M6DPI6_9CNID